MYGQDIVRTRDNIVEEYGPDLEILLKFVPYLINSRNKMTQKYYEGDGEKKIIPVPVYDSTLLSFVKTAKTTKFINKNYPYTYRRYRIVSTEDEIAAMEKGKITDLDLYRGILSKYILEGQTKGVMWTKGVTDGIYVTALTKLKMLFYDHSVEPGKINNV